MLNSRLFVGLLALLWGAALPGEAQVADAPSSILSFTMQPEPGETPITGTVARVTRVSGEPGFYDFGWPVHWDLTLKFGTDDEPKKGSVYHLTPLTLVVSRDGHWRSFDSLREGQKVTLLGAGLADKTSDPPVRVVILPEESADIPDPPLNITPPAPAPLWEGTQGNLTMRVTRAGWFDRRQAAGESATNRAPIFGFLCEFSGPLPRQVADYGLRVPPGELMRSMKILDRPVALFSASPGNTNAVRGISENIDPAWDTMTVQVEALDPLAPEGTGGMFRSRLEWKDAVLQANGAATLANRTLTTSLGTRITLESLKIDKGHTICRFRVKPSSRAPQAELSLLPRLLRDDQGRVSRLGGGGESGQDDMVEQTNEGAPAKGAKSVSLTFLVVEKAPELADPRWLRHFRFSLLPRALRAHSFGNTIPKEFNWGGSPEQFTGAVVAHAQNQEARADLEMLPDEWSGQQGWRVWLSPNNDQNSMFWKLRELRVRAEGKEIPVRLDYFPDEPQFIKADGSWAKPTERSDRAEVQMPETSPNTVQVEAEVESQQRRDYRRHGLWPLPKPGATLDLTTQATPPESLDEHEFFQPLSLTDFESPIDLPGLPASWASVLRGPGLALVVKLKPGFGGSIENYQGMIIDDTGADLRVEPPYLEHWIAGDATQKSATIPAANTFTFLLRAPRAEARNVEAWLFATETLSGQRSKITFAPINRQQPK